MTKTQEKAEESEPNIQAADNEVQTPEEKTGDVGETETKATEEKQEDPAGSEVQPSTEKKSKKEAVTKTPTLNEPVADATPGEEKKEAAIAESPKKQPSIKVEKVDVDEVEVELKAEIGEKPKVKEEPTKKIVEKDILSFDVPTEEYDWENADSSGFGEEYSDSEKEKMAAEFFETLTSITEKEVIKGIVVGVNPRDIILNIGFKSDGMVSSTEFKDLPDLKVGDEVEVYIEEQENTSGQLVLSRRKAKIVKAWENIQSSFDNDEVIQDRTRYYW